MFDDFCEEPSMNELRLEQHPNKTMIGRLERGFDFLRYQLNLDTLSVAEKTLKRFENNITRLYKQGGDSVRIGQHIKKWAQWLCGSACLFATVSKHVIDMLLCPWNQSVIQKTGYLNIVITCSSSSNKTQACNTGP